MPPIQSTRFLEISTPLGPDALLLAGFKGREELGRLFAFELDLLSNDASLAFDEIVGKPVTLRVDLPEGGERFWHGYISRFSQETHNGTADYARYSATMVPWLWFLTRKSDCRVFQEKRVPEILREIFDEHGFTDIEDRLDMGNYRTWNYCVQYRESDYNFVCRLMEQEGIYTFFKHEDGLHTLVLCDSLSKHEPWEGYEEIAYRPHSESTTLRGQISNWTINAVVKSGKYAHTDYNFEKPKTKLLHQENLARNHDHADYEVFDYPADSLDRGEAEQYAKVRIEELQTRSEMLHGQTDARGLVPGHMFTMTDHPRADQNREYLITAATYDVKTGGYAQDTKEDIFDCAIEAIDAQTQFRPKRSTPKPLIRGSQTAVTVGPAGEEIYTDKYGRIKVQFFWDRDGTFDENSSCWIRVSQLYAGKGWGGMCIPRIGQEVIVDFLEGDPDHPIITGRVYNADQMPPYDLPGGNAVSGVKSSTVKGGGYNEFILDDTKSNELIRVHGQYDMDTTIENDERMTVHNNRTVTVDVDHRLGRIKQLTWRLTKRMKWEPIR